MNTLSHSYNLALVSFSYLLAVLASYTALNVSARIHGSLSKGRLIWLCTGAVSMGLGIWAMHFVAMLALHLPIQVHYDVGIVFLSILFAIIASGIALWVISTHSLTGKRLLVGALFMGAGIASMHYTGMAAMQMDAVITYDWFWFSLSILVAIAVSVVALHLTYRLRNADSAKGFRLKLLAGLLMGAAVVGMHYTGMFATTFVSSHHTVAKEAYMAADARMIAYAVGVVMLLILGVTLVSIYMDKLFAGKTRRIMESDQRYKSLFEHNYDAVIFYSVDGKESVLNPAAIRLTEEKWLPLEAFIRMCDIEDGECVASFFDLAVRGESRNYDIALTTQQRQIHLNMTNVPVFVDHKVAGVFLIARDVTVQKQAEAKVNYLAFHDALTGLPNRRFVEEKLDAMIEEARQLEYIFYVMFLDLDRFKLVNDSLGHDYGDLLLKEAAMRLSNCIGQRGVVSRLGGDEFMVIMADVSEETVVQVADSLNRTIEQSFLINGHELYITTSIGISRYPMDGEDRHGLMKTADTAMYSAKERGKNSYHMYAPDLQQITSDKMFIQNELNRALALGELTLYYQPQVSATDGAIVGMEALIRWNHPERGLVSPDQFIAVAEETGLIVPIGEWVLQTACQQNKVWQDLGLPPIRVAVNLSARQFLKKDFTQMVADILEQTGLAPHFLELEITESTMIDVHRASNTLAELKRLGVYIAIDDFGTGYSSLSYLKEFPLNRLKIDRSFVRDMKKSASNRAIVSTIISMAHHLELKVIAEGVETDDDLAFLQEHLCEEVQGYLFSKPLPLEEITSYLQEQTLKIS
ncbi:EAL domain-containing protein [Brevibacillus choshinensis]|uniref:bifunctional diguanylate cyclase/phosphodiesterase n=1 Tax=Brevibacillus choshinensis TaxID=54911 RepID=UPI002E1D769B|nr:EAL domain-containing protein [Brevibacillus choshinensis]